MKKVFYATLALGALIFASCQKENSAVLPKVDSPVFTAHIDSGTKTALNGQKSEWVSGDAIRVLNGTNTTGCAAEYTTTDSGASARFTTDVEGFTGDAFIAMYPASQAGKAWWNDDYDQIVNKLKLKPSQTAVAGGYDPEAHIAVAYSKTKTLSFSNAVSLLKFTCGSDNISEVCVYANAKATGGTGTESKNVLSGDFNFNTKTNEVITETGDDVPTNNYVKVTGTFVKGQTYYIACLPTTFTEGFTVEVVSNGIKGEDKKTEKPYTLKRNKILDLGTVEYVAPTMQTVYLNPGPWTSDNAVLSVYFWGAGEGWADFADADGDGRYEAQIPIGVTKCHYIRSNPDKTHNWDGVWNRADNLDLTMYNCITVNENWTWSTSKEE